MNTARSLTIVLCGFAFVLSSAQADEKTALLPIGAAEVLAVYQARVSGIERDAQEKLQRARCAAVSELVKLQSSLAEAGRTDDAAAIAQTVQQLVAKTAVREAPAPVAPPDSPAQWRDRVGKSYFCEVTGVAEGIAWGTDVYTDDSDIGAAAVHAGALKAGEKGVVKITIAAPLEGYRGSLRNDVTTSDWGPWAGTFTIERANESELPPVPMGDGATIADPGSLSTLARRPGEVFLIELVGAAGGAVWGTDVYTADSSLATAAVHAGLLKVGERQVVRATIVAGQAEYTGSERNGVTTRSWSSYRLSYRLAAAE